MTKQKNASDDTVLQYRFTAYIVKALRNCRADYYNRQIKKCSVEIPYDESADERNLLNFDYECDWGRIEDYIENEVLINALQQLSDVENNLIYMKMVRQMAPTEIANSLGKNVSAVNKMQYRAISKLRSEMGCPFPRKEPKNEFYRNADCGKAERPYSKR